jgi:hypothetical protein
MNYVPKTLARQDYENNVIVAFEAWDERRRKVYADFLNTKRLAICTEEQNQRRRSEELSRADNILEVELSLAWQKYDKTNEGGSLFHGVLIKSTKVKRGWILKSDSGHFLIGDSPAVSNIRSYVLCGEILKECGYYNHKFGTGWRLFISDDELPAFPLFAQHSDYDEPADVTERKSVKRYSEAVNV